MQSTHNIVFAAGGTGGHIFPALAVAEALLKLKPDTQITFIGSGGPIERKILEARSGIKYLPVNSSALRGKGAAGILKFLFVAPKSIISCRSYFKQNKVSCVIGFGGYPSALPVIAAKLSGLPVLIQEQNAVVGFANKFLSLFAQHIFCVPGAAGFYRAKKITEVMNPVRANFESISQVDITKKLKILIMGGSQGAVSLNDAILELVDFFAEKQIAVIHQCGDRDLERITKRYQANNSNIEVRAFIDNLDQVLASVQLVICRAGATSIAEISAAGRAAIYVPLPIAGGHQAENTKELVRLGAAKMFAQDANLANNLKLELEKLINNPNELVKMGQLAKERYNYLGKSSSMVIAEALTEFLK